MTKEDLEKEIAEHQDFPIEGVLFRDLSPVFKNHFTDLIDLMTDMIGQDSLKACDYFAGIESRGFILASALAQKFNKGTVLIRKPGKLPGEVLTQSYSLEYGEGQLQMHKGEGKMILVDDVLATGGTLMAAQSLSQKAGYEILDRAVCINLKDLNASNLKDLPVKALFTY
jgi:adenine phosphoribosyltransferase